MRKEDVYLRFFVNLPALDECRADPLCNVDYENQMAFTAVTGDPENEKVVGCSCYVVDADDKLAEVAYMIQPEWQGLGIGTALQQRMEEYARSKGIRGFKAYILTQNQKMQGLIQKGEKVTFKRGADEFEVVSLF
ncbi:MAG: N-acetyltransferase family protein [Desulfosalsimonas sp.]